jgi:tetratricopeptide (TPR) repeat protein
MRNLLSLLLLFLTASADTLAQQWVAQLKPDSLEQVLRTAQDTQRVNTLNLLARRNLYMSQGELVVPGAEAQTDEALRLATALGYQRGMGNAYLNKGIMASSKGSFADALPHLRNATFLTRKTGDRFALAAAYDFTSLAYQMKGESRTAIVYSDSAVRLYQQLGDTVTAVWSMVSMGNAYFMLGDYPNAYKTEQTAYQITPEKDTTLKTVTLFYLTNLYLGAELPELALEQVNKILAYFPGEAIQKKLVASHQVTSALILGGEAYLQLGQVDSAQKIAAIVGEPVNFDNVFHQMFLGRLAIVRHQYHKALGYLQGALALARKSDQPIFVSRTARELARAYLGLGEHQKAIVHAEEALRTAEKIDALLEMTNAAATLAEIYDGLKDYNKAYYYSKLHRSLIDSLMPESYKRKLSLVQVQNELAIQKGQAELLAKESQLKEQRLKRESLMRNLLLGGFALFVVMSLIVFRNITLKRKNEKLRLNHQLQLQQFESEHTKDRLQKHAAELEMQALRAQMNPHFIFNCLNAINHFILKNETETASDFLTRFSRLIRMVLQSSSHKYISLHDELETLKLYIGLERVRFRNHFTYALHCPPSVDVESLQIPPMLLQPFVENAIWHGLMHRAEGGQLTIDIEEQGAMLQCTIEDNGIGREKAARLKSKSASFKKSMGLEITTSRLQMLQTTRGEAASVRIIDLQDEQGEAAGTRVVLRIPVKLAEAVTV